MKRFALALAVLTIEPALSAPTPTSVERTMSIQNYSCAYATIMGDDSVVIDWQCVQLQALAYKHGRGKDPHAAFAFVLEALRSGNAIAK